jgi:hypothetical protein
MENKMHCLTALFSDFIFSGSAKNMYTHFNRRYLCIIFEVEFNCHYNM